MNWSQWMFASGVVLVFAWISYDGFIKFKRRHARDLD
jgi:hypothetical protein